MNDTYDIKPSDLYYPINDAIHDLNKWFGPKTNKGHSACKVPHHKRKAKNRARNKNKRK